MVPEPAAAGGDIGGVGAEQSERSVPGSLQTLHQRVLNNIKRARRSYNSAPRPLPPPPPSRQQIVSLSQSSRVSPRRPSLLTGEGGGVGLEPGPSIHRSIISALLAGEAEGMPVEAQLMADVVLQNK